MWNLKVAAQLGQPSDPAAAQSSLERLEEALTCLEKYVFESRGMICRRRRAILIPGRNYFADTGAYLVGDRITMADVWLLCYLAQSSNTPLDQIIEKLPRLNQYTLMHSKTDAFQEAHVLHKQRLAHLGATPILYHSATCALSRFVRWFAIASGTMCRRDFCYANTVLMRVGIELEVEEMNYFDDKKTALGAKGELPMLEDGELHINGV